MKYTMILLGCLVALACSKNEGNESGDYFTSEALLINQLPVDGCSWHFSITQGDVNLRYSADAGSEERLIQPFIQTQSPTYGVYSIQVEISFRLTQKKRDVICGWNTILSMSEIEITSIQKM